MPHEQLSLFGDSDAVEPVVPDAAVRHLADALPGRVRIGTSSWSFRGWTGIVYASCRGRAPTEQVLARHGLKAYAAHPLFRTVSLDRTFYAPLPVAAFDRYASQVPETFRFVVKAPAAVTDPVVRSGPWAAATGNNPSFLDAVTASTAFVRPVVAGLGPRAGPLVFQFPPLGRRLLADVPRLAARIAAFLAVLPRGPLYAVEVRDPEFACESLAAALASAGAVPCLSLHARMPAVEEQAERLGLLGPTFHGPLVVRWNLHGGRDYTVAKQAYLPFDRLVEEDLPTRSALAAMACRAAAADRDVFITINNKAEGSAPLSVRHLAAAIVATGNRGNAPFQPRNSGSGDDL